MVIHILAADERPEEGSYVTTQCGHRVRFASEGMQWNDGHMCEKCFEIHRDMPPGQPKPRKAFVVVDGNFVCGGCGGVLVEVRRQLDGRRVFNCARCHENECLECTVCHYPRSIWADDGGVCGVCALEVIEKRRELTREQTEGIKKWTVTIPRVPPLPRN